MVYFFRFKITIAFSVLYFLSAMDIVSRFMWTTIVKTGLYVIELEVRLVLYRALGPLSNKAVLSPKHNFSNWL